MPQVPRRTRPNRYRQLRLGALRERLIERHARGESYKALAAWLADAERIEIQKAELRRFLVKGENSDNVEN